MNYTKEEIVKNKKTEFTNSVSHLLNKIHWSIKGSIASVFLAGFALLNFILSIDFTTYSVNYNWLMLLMAAISFFIVCSIVYVIYLNDE